MEPWSVKGRSLVGPPRNGGGYMKGRLKIVDTSRQAKLLEGVVLCRVESDLA